MAAAIILFPPCVHDISDSEHDWEGDNRRQPRLLNGHDMVNWYVTFHIVFKRSNNYMEGEKTCGILVIWQFAGGNWPLVSK